ncbi:MAG: HAMP domain-containing sensor histidine kinase [Spirochaetales bacterium]|nr:HAMP domain-containing sensor histidine kinase [Spirochaetales bacterium]
MRTPKVNTLILLVLSLTALAVISILSFFSSLIPAPLYSGAVILFSLGVSSFVIMIYLNHKKRTDSLSLATRSLSMKLTALANGEREVSFYTKNPSEFNEIAQAAELLQYELDKNEKERVRWSQDITHDLRTPVTAMKIQLEGMRDGVLSHSKERYDILFKEINELEIMLSDFSLLNRIETPDLVLQKEWLSSEEIINSLTGRFRPQADKDGINLISRWDKFYFKADSSLFLRAASNLVQNALSYSSSGSEVHLSFRLYDNMIQLTVENPGTIPEEELPLLFQRLYRGESSRTTSGSGLGLTIAKSIAQHHQGDIQAMNSNRGTTLFIMTINMVIS